MNRLSILFVSWLLLAVSACSTVETPSVGGREGVERVDFSGVSSSAQNAYINALNAMEKGKDEQAESKLVDMIAEFPDFAGPYANLGIIYARADRLEEAQKMFEQAVTLNPQLAPAYNALGVVHRRRGQFTQAEKSYQQALAVDKDYAPVHCNLAILYDLYLQQPQQAVVHYQRYAELVPAEQQSVNKWLKEIERRIGKVAPAEETPSHEETSE